MKKWATCALLVAFTFSTSPAFAGVLPTSDPNKTSFTAIVDSGTSQNRVSGAASEILPVCAPSQQSWCISSLEVDFGNNKFVPAKFYKYVDNGVRPDSLAVQVFPEKSAISLWTAKRPDGTDALVAVHSVLAPNLFSSSIYSVKEVKSNVKDDIWGSLNNGLADYRLSNPGYVDDCAYVSQGICGQRISSQGSIYRLTQFVSNDYATWFAGRLIGSTYLGTKISDTQTKLVTTGAPVKVPEVIKEEPGVDRLVASGCTDPVQYAKDHPHVDQRTLDSLCAQAKFSYEMCFPENKWPVGSSMRVECSLQTRMNSFYFAITPFTNNFALLNLYLTSLPSSTRDSEIWTFQSAGSVHSSMCLENGNFLGAINTNALVFDAYPPLLINGQLNYRVSSPHLNTQNVENVGAYELQLNSDVLRCMYNFTKAPIEVKVSVTSEDGVAQIATTNWSESNGISRLTIAGFHYSSPKIQVAFTQSPEVTKIIAKPKTIVCIKGRTSKKVSGLEPKCPTGYKRK